MHGYVNHVVDVQAVTTHVDASHRPVYSSTLSASDEYKCQVMGMTEEEYRRYVHQPAKVQRGCYEAEIVS
jgi:hypothetical protein